MISLPTTLLRLWELAGGDPLDPTCDWNTTFDPVGLILSAPPHNWDYWCTPINSITFANTGGDGVHYGFLALDGEVTDSSPIVMTVPCCDTPNMVVGENFLDFLALGCRYGYFGLEQLVHDKRNTIHELELQRFDPEATFQELKLLDLITSTFQLKPWPDPQSHLLDLDSQYHRALLLKAPEEID